MPKLDQVQLGGSSKASNVQVIGVQDIINTIREISSDIRVSAVRKALYAGAKVIRDEARLRAPVRSGALKRSIEAQTRIGKMGADGKPTYIIGVVKVSKRAFVMSGNGKASAAKREPGQKRAYKKGQIYPRNYAHLVEFGTAPHNVSKGKAGNKLHPGAQPKPFMRPAFDTKVDEARAAIAESLIKSIAASAAKRAKKGAKKGAGK